MKIERLAQQDRGGAERLQTGDLGRRVRLEGSCSQLRALCLDRGVLGTGRTVSRNQELDSFPLEAFDRRVRMRSRVQNLGSKTLMGTVCDLRQRQLCLHVGLPWRMSYPCSVRMAEYNLDGINCW